MQPHEKLHLSTHSSIKKCNQADNTKAQITSDLEILYIAKDQIFVETQNGDRISFSRGSINGVVWLK